MSLSLGKRSVFALSAVAVALLLFVGGALSPWAGSASTEVAEKRTKPSGPVEEGFASIQQARDEADPTEYVNASRSFAEALEIDPKDFRATLGTAILAGSTHDFASQVTLAERAVDLNPHNATARGVLGDGLLEMGRVEAAERSYQKMIDLRPDLAGYARVAGLFNYEGESDRALEAMQLSLEASPTPRDQAWALAQIGEIHISDRDLDAASRAFETAHALDPDYFLPDVGRAHVAFARGDLDTAISLQTSVVERYPAAAMAAELGDMLWVAGREDEAEAMYERSAALTDRLLANGVLPDVEMPVFFADDRRDPERALAMAEEIYASRVTPATTDALAWAHRANGNLDRAEKLISGLLNDPNVSPHALFHAGMIASDQGRDRVAIRRLERALDAGNYWAFRYPVEARRALEQLSS